MYEGMLAETVTMRGHQGDEIAAYYSRPLGAGPFPGVVVIHHAPGWDEWNREVTRKLASHGYAAICPNLYHRENPNDPIAGQVAARAAGGVPDDRLVGDVEGAMRFLRSQPYASGKVGIIGFCSGGRQVYISACKIKGIDAAVDCWGGRVVQAADQLTPRQPVAPIDMTKDLGCPLLGIFGEEDQNPDPAQVAKIEAELKKYGKTYEFHTYKGAGHSIFVTDRPAYRVEAAVDGWNKVFAFYEKYLKAATPAEMAAR